MTRDSIGWATVCSTTSALAPNKFRSPDLRRNDVGELRDRNVGERDKPRNCDDNGNDDRQPGTVDENARQHGSCLRLGFGRLHDLARANLLNAFRDTRSSAAQDLCSTIDVGAARRSDADAADLDLVVLVDHQHECTCLIDCKRLPRHHQ